MVRLGVNIDHIATLRNARGELFPSVIEAALIAETNGADLITAHLREDRRHIKDDDIFLLKQVIKTQLNLEMAATEEMLEIALSLKPDFVCLVPEKRHELTTEGGLNILNNYAYINDVVKTLQDNSIKVSLFIDPDQEQIIASRDINAYAIELHTGKYASLKDNYMINEEFYKIKTMVEFADSMDLVVNAGHGLNYHNVLPIANIPKINELNIGFAIIAKSLFIGLSSAVQEMKFLLNKNI
jgi:pyridoxine 5-phosphate synthase